MLHSLSIKNYALIAELQVNFKEGFTIMTGETGAGKSIILGGLSLLLGKRADFSVIRDPQKKCVVEGIFNISNYNLESFFKTHKLDYEPQTIIRREILSQKLGRKSRAFINDTPTNLETLQALGTKLLDIHSQHETLSLGETRYQFHVMDVLAKNRKLLAQYTDAFTDLKKLKNELNILKEDQAAAAKAHDYNNFLLNELREAGLEEGMQESLEDRYQTLSHVEALQENLGAVLQGMRQEGTGVLDALATAKHHLKKAAEISTKFEVLYERLQSVAIEVDDLDGEFENALEKVEASPTELEQVNRKLEALYNLQKKHGVSEISELKVIEAELQQKVSLTENAEESIARAEKAISDKEKQLQDLANKLHANRKKIIPPFQKEIETMLFNLGMPHARLEIRLNQQKNFLTNGQDELAWLLSANKGEKFMEIKKAASGGEMSRIMLAVKGMLASYGQLPTIIFDEIDTGVSGEIAQNMGYILQKMSKTMQVIAITHLPQIAGKGNQHFKIYKENESLGTVTHIKELQSQDRIAELAKMLGGKKPGASALAHAKALLN